MLRISREPGFTEPWLCLLLTPDDSERRLLLTSLLVTPERWTGRRPE